MLILRQYSTSLERRGISEAFHHWLETGDFLVSEFKTRKKKIHTHTHVMNLCACRVPEERVCNWQAAGEEWEWPVPHLQWPALAHAVGTGGCNCVCLCVCVSIGLWGSLLSPSLRSGPHGEGCSCDRHKSGRLSCVTGGRETEDRGSETDYGEGKRQRRWERLSMLNWDRCRGLMRLRATHKLFCNKTSSSLQQKLVWPMCMCLWRKTAKTCIFVTAHYKYKILNLVETIQ